LQLINYSKLLYTSLCPQRGRLTPTEWDKSRLIFVKSVDLFGAGTFGFYSATPCGCWRLFPRAPLWWVGKIGLNWAFIDIKLFW